MDFMMKFLGMTCKDTSPLISEMMDHRVPLFKRWKIKIHLSLCQVCMYYKEQLESIQNLAKRLGQEDVPVKKDATLPPESKQKLKAMLEANKQK